MTSFSINLSHNDRQITDNQISIFNIIKDFVIIVILFRRFKINCTHNFVSTVYNNLDFLSKLVSLIGG